MKRIFLTGFMGAGKTTLGRAFARAKGLEFIDLDWYIEERHHRTVSELFDKLGEEGFRRVESNLLREVAEFENVVVATGGGTPCFLDNMEVMNRAGVTVFLDVPVDVLFRRLKVARSSRPLLAQKNDAELEVFIREALERRMPYYGQSMLRFAADRLEDRRQIEVAVTQLSELLETTGKE